MAPQRWLPRLSHAASGLPGKLARVMGRLPSIRVHRILQRISEPIQARAPVAAVLESLEAAKPELYSCLHDVFEHTVAQALTLKILNLCLAKYHLQARSSTVLSKPYSLNIDPSDACNLACPGCVHSNHVKELKLFVWDKQLLPPDRLSAFMQRYGPSAIHTIFCNYGEPLINPETPKYFRTAKRYLMQAMTSTSMSIGRFDAEAYADSGLDYMLVSIDGATQPVYEKFRRNGNLKTVLRNLEKLVEAKQKLGRRTPIIAWRLLTFEHNFHEIPAALEIARNLGLDQFLTLSPYDVSWDDPTMRGATVEHVNVNINLKSEADILENWNPFADNLESAAIERAFEKPWAAVPLEVPATESQSSCHWLYKSVTIDGGGRMFPCCAPPRPDIELNFAHFDGAESADPFNNEKYRLARLSFSDPVAYQRERAARPAEREPHCANCEWTKDRTNTDASQIRQYFKAASREVFGPESVEMLVS
jgi:pyruvate-formate lyase-activating enzyme